MNFLGIDFDFENTWTPYRELALTPSVHLILDSNHPSFYCLSFHFLSVKVAISKSSDLYK